MAHQGPKDPKIPQQPTLPVTFTTVRVVTVAPTPLACSTVGATALTSAALTVSVRVSGDAYLRRRGAAHGAALQVEFKYSRSSTNVAIICGPGGPLLSSVSRRRPSVCCAIEPWSHGASDNTLSHFKHLSTRHAPRVVDVHAQRPHAAGRRVGQGARDGGGGGGGDVAARVAHRDHVHGYVSHEPCARDCD